MFSLRFDALTIWSAACLVAASCLLNVMTDGMWVFQSFENRSSKSSAQLLAGSKLLSEMNLNLPSRDIAIFCFVKLVLAGFWIIC